MTLDKTSPPAAGDTKKTLRAIAIAALPVYLAVHLAAYGVNLEVAAGLSLAIIGIGERSWRLFRHRFPSIGWLVGGEGPDPTLPQPAPTTRVVSTEGQPPA